MVFQFVYPYHNNMNFSEVLIQNLLLSDKLDILIPILAICVMAIIIYSLSGEGSGHSSRSREMITHLLKMGHTVKVASYNRGYSNLKDDFDVLEIEGFSIISEDNKVSIGKTFAQSFNTILDRYEAFNILRRSILRNSNLIAS